MPRKDYKFSFPFEPPMEDLKMVVETANGAKCYIFDTCVVTDPAERAEIDRKVAQIIIERDRKAFFQKMKQEAATGTAD